MFRSFAAAAALAILLVGAARAGEPTRTTVLLRTETTNIGQKLVYPRRGTPEITTMIVELAPGAKTVLHTHPFPLVAYMLEGTLEVRYAGGEVHRYQAGDSFVEAGGHVHQGVNVGTGPVRILVTVIGVKGVPYAHAVKR
jgi:quercetin dioxygenase-like cupin family protein